MRRLPIVDVAAIGLTRALTSLPRMLAIFSLPFLLPAFLEIALSFILADTLRESHSRQLYITFASWLSLAFWGASMAIAYMALLRWVLHDEPRRGVFQLDLSRATLLAMPVIAAWFLADAAIELLPPKLYAMIDTTRHRGLFDVEVDKTLLYTIYVAVWAIRLGLTFLSLGMAAVIAQHERIDFYQYGKMLRSQPIRMILVVVFAEILLGGMRILLVNGSEFVGLRDFLVPLSVGSFDASGDISSEIFRVIPLFIFNFLSFLIQMPPIIEAFGWLIGQKRKIPSAVAATFS